CFLFCFLFGVPAACGLGEPRDSHHFRGAPCSAARTFSSSLEAVLAALSLEQLLAAPPRSAPRAALALGALQVALRPTAAGFWLAWAVAEMAKRRSRKQLQELILVGVSISGTVLAVSTLLDSLYYGGFCLVPWNFLRFNVLQDGSALYGSHPWYWYAEGLAVTLGTFLPFTCLGVVQALRRPLLWAPLLATGASLAVLSCASHKEYRFLLPHFPLFSLLTGLGLHAMRAGRWTLGLVFAPQAVAALFFCLVHQRGGEAVMGHLRQHPAESVFFLTACHATPFHSFVHGTKNMGFLDCSPGQGSPRDRFFQQPMAVLPELFPDALGSPAASEASKAEAPAPAEGRAMQCLEHRYQVKPQPLPEILVLWGGLLLKESAMSEWLEVNGYQLERFLADGIWSEGPYGLEMWPSFSIFRRKL
ncbi:unnamed protein product, partial [Effrenium voratum]